MKPARVAVAGCDVPLWTILYCVFLLSSNSLKHVSQGLL